MANNLQIFFELQDGGANRDQVDGKIKELGGWARVSASFWYVSSTLTASQARDQIAPVLRAGDKLFVVNASNGQAAWRGLPDKVSAYVKQKWTL